MQRAFGETDSDWGSLGRDFRCDAEQEDSDLMLDDGGEEEENFSLVDFRFSLSDSVASEPAPASPTRMLSQRPRALGRRPDGDAGVV